MEKSIVVAIVCTNMRGAPLAQALEAKLGIPIYDSIATAVWKCLLLTGADPRQINGWGGLFHDARLSVQT
jgi:maleate isomerase